MRFKYRLNTDHVMVFGRWVPRMAVVGIPRGIWYYRWLHFHVFFIEWAKFGLSISRAWLRSKEPE